MSITNEQQTLDDALVPREQRLTIGSCNYRLSTTFKPKEPTFQVALDIQDENRRVLPLDLDSFRTKLQMCLKLPGRNLATGKCQPKRNMYVDLPGQSCLKQPSLLVFNHDDVATQDEEVNEEDSFDRRVQTPSHVKSTNDEDSDDVIQDANVEGDMINEEETHEEVEANVLYRDVNVNLEGRDTVMTDAPLPNVQATQETKDTHVDITI
ncbi:hypothetical protein Tco_0779117 [Tanacetum coccineum]